MLSYFVKMLFRSFFTFVFLFLVVISGFYAVYFANSSSDAVSTLTSYYVSEYRPHIVLSILPSPNGQDTELSDYVVKLERINDTLSSLASKYTDLDISWVYCLYRFSLNGTEFRIIVGDPSSLSSFGFLADNPTVANNTVYILHGYDIISNLSDSIVRSIGLTNVTMYSIYYFSVSYPLNDYDYDFVDIFIPVRNLSELINNTLLINIIDNVENNESIDFKTKVAYTYIALNYVNIEYLQPYMDNPRKIMDIVYSTVEDFVKDLSSKLNLKFDYASFVIATDNTRQTEQKEVKYDGHILVINQDLFMALLSEDRVLGNVFSRNISIVILMYLPIGIFLLYSVRKLRAIFIHEAYEVLQIRGINAKKILLYSYTSFIVLLVLVLLGLDVVLYYKLRLDMSSLIIYSVAVTVITIVSLVVKDTPSIGNRTFMTILLALFVFYLYIGYARLSVPIISIELRYLLIPAIIAISLSPMYSLLIPFILYELYTYTIDALIRRIPGSAMILRPIAKYSILWFTAIYSAVMLVIIHINPYRYLYQYIIEFYNEYQWIGIDKITELGVMSRWLSMQFNIYTLILVSSLALGIIILLREVHMIIMYSMIRGFEKRLVYRDLAKYNSLLFTGTVFLLFLALVVLMMFYDAHMGILYTTVKNAISYQSTSYIPQISIDTVFKPPHVWEGVSR